MINLAVLVAVLTSPPVSGSLYESKAFTKQGEWSFGVEGISAALDGRAFAMNLKKKGTIGLIRPDGTTKVWAKLPAGSVGNGSRIGPRGMLYVADYRKHTVWRLDLASGARNVHFHDDSMHQPNDVAIADDGSLYLSDPHWKTRSGRVWRVDPKGKGTVAVSGIGTVNGIELSPDGRTLYVAESVQRQIWKYRLDKNGRLGAKTLVYGLAKGAKPRGADFDGLRTDSAGRLFATHNGGGEILVFGPDGRLERRVETLGKNPTNLAFGGPDGKTVFVTMRDSGRIETFRTEHPGRAWKQQQRWGSVKGR